MGPLVPLCHCSRRDRVDGVALDSFNASNRSRVALHYDDQWSAVSCFCHWAICNSCARFGGPVRNLHRAEPSPNTGRSLSYERVDIGPFMPSPKALVFAVSNSSKSISAWLLNYASSSRRTKHDHTVEIKTNHLTDYDMPVYSPGREANGTPDAAALRCNSIRKNRSL